MARGAGSKKGGGGVKQRSGKERAAPPRDKTPPKSPPFGRSKTMPESPPAIRSPPLSPTRGLRKMKRVISSMTKDLAAMELQDIGDQAKNLLRAQREKLSSMLENEHLNRIKSEFREVRESVKHRKDRLQGKFREVFTGDESKRIRDHVREKIHERIEKIEEKIEPLIAKKADPKNVLKIDKWVFTGAVAGAFFSEYVYLQHADKFWIWFAIVITTSMSTKLAYYSTIKMHFFMLDFCYFTNLCCLALLFTMKSSCSLYKVCFIFANGPVAFAVPVWKNSLVFHDINKVQTVYIHLFPLLLLRVLRWSPQPDFPDLAQCGPVEGADLLNALGVYLGWQVLYLFITEVTLAKHLDRNPLLSTSLRWLTRDSKNGLHKIVLKLCRQIAVMGKDEVFDPNSVKTKVIFCTAQLIYTVFTFVVTPFVFASYILHLLWSLAIGGVVLINGAEFYMEVFSRRYISSVEKHHAETVQRLEKRQRARQLKREGKADLGEDKEQTAEEYAAELRSKCD
jgi:hypothetical protein